MAVKKARSSVSLIGRTRGLDSKPKRCFPGESWVSPDNGRLVYAESPLRSGPQATPISSV